MCGKIALRMVRKWWKREQIAGEVKKADKNSEKAVESWKKALKRRRVRRAKREGNPAKEGRI
jgi:hypothetical protein